MSIFYGLIKNEVNSVTVDLGLATIDWACPYSSMDRTSDFGSEDLRSNRSGGTYSVIS